MFSYQLLPGEEQVVIKCDGDIDIDASEMLVEDEIHSIVSDYKNIIFNFENVYFVDSSGIGLIITIVNELKESGRAVRIEQIRPEVMEVFELLQMDEILGRDTFE